VFVKICGITNESDALMAVAMGADAVGFVFAPSTRQLALTQAREIARRLPPEIVTVGVFRDEAPQRVVEMVNSAGLRGAQLHGHESPAEARWVRGRVPFVIKAFAAGDRQLEKADEYPVDALLLDGATPGSGQVFDWSLVESMPVGARLILAGGLDPTNIAEAVGRVQPWGVDVSSGVESAPGRKDVRLTRAFINRAKAFEEVDEDLVEQLSHADLRHVDLDELEGMDDEPEVFDQDDDWG
jgi:phosphoribosylanthranilate isomerase